MGVMTLAVSAAALAPRAAVRSLATSSNRVRLFTAADRLAYRPRTAASRWSRSRSAAKRSFNAWTWAEASCRSTSTPWRALAISSYRLWRISCSRMAGGLG